MIEVYVWLPKTVGNQKNVGHASLLVRGHTYISWWPVEAVGLGKNYAAIRNKTYRSDVHDEGGPPDHTIVLNGLDEQAILTWWSGFGLVQNGIELHGPLPAYNLTSQNCSTIVALALKKAGADQYASWYSSWSVVWRPQTVLDYALAIRKGLGGN